MDEWKPLPVQRMRVSAADSTLRVGAGWWKAAPTAASGCTCVQGPPLVHFFSSTLAIYVHLFKLNV